jgi:WD40 repeat protein
MKDRSVTGRLATAQALLTDRTQPIGSVLTELRDRRLFTDACAEAALLDDPWLTVPDDLTRDLDPAHSGEPRPSSLAHALGLFRDFWPGDLARACAVVYAAAALRSRLHRGGRGETRFRVAAAMAWRLSLAGQDEPGLAPLFPVPGEEAGERALEDLAAAHPELRWEIIDDLVTALGRPRPAIRSIETRVVLGEAGARIIGKLAVDAIEDEAERALPDPLRAAFTYSPADVDADLRTAFDWARGREGFERGHGVRWRFLGTGGENPRVVGRAELGGAAALAFGRLFPPPGRRLRPPREWRAGNQDPRVVLVAGVTLNGMLRPAGEAAEATALVCGAEGITLLAPPDADTPAASARSTNGRVRSASTVDEAARKSQRPRPRRRWAAIGAVVALLLSLGVTGLVRGYSSARHQAERQAGRLAGQALGLASAAPDRAILLGLAAEAIDPKSADARAALLTTADADSRIEHVVPTHINGIRRLGISADGAWIAAVGADARPHVWHAGDAREIPLPAGTGTASAVAFPPVPGPFAMGGEGGVTLWDPVSHGARRLPFATAVTSLAFSPDGRTLAGGAADGSVTLWDLAGGRPDTAHVHRAAVRGLAFDPAGRALVSTGDDGTVLSRTSESRFVTARKKQVEQPGRSVVFGKNGQSVFVSGGHQLTIWKAGLSGRLRPPVHVPENPEIAYSGSADRLYIAASNGVYETYADPKTIVNSGGALNPAGNGLGWRADTGSVVAVSGGGRHAVARTGSGAVIVYSLETKRNRAAFVGGVRDVYPLPGSRWALAVLENGFRPVTVAIVDPRTGEIGNYSSLTDRSVGSRPNAFSARRSLLAVATGTTVYVWSVRGTTLGRPVKLADAGQRARSVAFDEGKDRLIAAWQHSIATYDMSDPAHPRRLFRTAVSSPVFAVASSSSARVLFVATLGGTYALPGSATGDGWRRRVTLTTGFIQLLDARPDGSAVAGTYNGEALLFHRTGSRSWRRVVLTGASGQQSLLTTFDDLVVSAGVGQAAIEVSDAETGRHLATIDLGAFVIPEGHWYSAPTLRIYEDVPGALADVTLGRDGVRRKACDLIGVHGQTVRTVWPQAPQAMRGRPLCP